MATTYIRRLDGRRPPQGSSSAGRFKSNPMRGGGSSRRTSGDGIHRSSGGRPSPRQGGGGRGGKRGFQEMQVDLSRLINKAVPAAETPAYVPEHAFVDFEVEQALKDNIISKGYVNPTPIQDQSIVHVLAGKDIVGMAQTGTGKTAAFLIPLIDKVLKNANERVLIMVPTRELAIQIEQEFYGFSKRLNLNSVVCVGGAGIDPQIRVLRRKPAFVIGTPGRLKDLMERRELDLSKFGTVVLDEADRMLDMGFIPDMRFILGHMPENRHTLFFSATMSREIENLIGSFLNDPVRVMVKTRDTASTIDQDVVRAGRGEEKFNKLVELLKRPDFEKTLVFGRTKFGVERMTRDLVRSGIRAESIHGDKTHGKRQKALSLFKADHVDVLVATDVAARGLDISGVSHVINYDLPATYEDYTHRIGRTGRAGKGGMALTFIDG
ncbi:DEAD/DEAH box helicase [Patescibacteria group bacterium]|nr:DEAD/DEAH box helicase [Patescibacteria group bacterium]MBU1754815.1 DEAD/DEAH box helicase [Patescibacteria group bacterium]